MTDALRADGRIDYHVTWLLSKGVGIKEVSERVGHSLTSTTQNIYQHSTPAGQAAAVKALAAIGSPAPALPGE